MNDCLTMGNYNQEKAKLSVKMLTLAKKNIELDSAKGLKLHFFFNKSLNAEL